MKINISWVFKKKDLDNFLNFVGKSVNFIVHPMLLKVSVQITF